MLKVRLKEFFLEMHCVISFAIGIFFFFSVFFSYKTIQILDFLVVFSIEDGVAKSGTNLTICLQFVCSDCISFHDCFSS